MPIGKFVVRCDFANRNVSAENLDYSGSSHRHPNISAHGVCLGGNSGLVQAMIRDGKLYDLINFFTLFFALFPQDNGSPYEGYMEWLFNKRKNPTGNPWINEPYIYKISNAQKVAKKKKPTKKTQEEPENIEPVVFNDEGDDEDDLPF
jgi:hypothetical protein